MTRTITFIIGVAVAALTLVPAALADAWYADRQATAPDAFERAVASANVGGSPVSPDAFERAVQGGNGGTASMLDARERSLLAKPAVEYVSPLDRREAAFQAKREAQLAGGSGLDVFERTVVASTGESAPLVGDDRFRIDTTTSPVPVTLTSGRDIEWPQIGIGLGIGLLLGLGVMLAMRYTRIRPLAH